MLLQLTMKLYYSNFILIFLFLSLSTNIASSNNDAQQFMGIQNAARAALKLPPLVWDPKIVQYAAWYAYQRRADCELQHSNGPYGENIFWGSGDGWTPAQAAAAWVSERRGTTTGPILVPMDNNVGIILRLCGGTLEELGVPEWFVMKGKGVFMTCNYDPPGNFFGERHY